MTVDLQKLLDLQDELQTKSYGKSPRNMTDEERVVFIKDMYIALSNELNELIDEVPAWKPWVDREKLADSGKPLFNLEAARGEFIDMAHFWMNFALVLELDAEDIERRYVAKRSKNARRQELGYDGVSEKCGECKRALDDDAVLCVKSSGPSGVQFWCERTKAWTAATTA